MRRWLSMPQTCFLASIRWLCIVVNTSDFIRLVSHVRESWLSIYGCGEPKPCGSSLQPLRVLLLSEFKAEKHSKGGLRLFYRSIITARSCEISRMPCLWSALAALTSHNHLGQQRLWVLGYHMQISGAWSKQRREKGTVKAELKNCIY